MKALFDTPPAPAKRVESHRLRTTALNRLSSKEKETVKLQEAPSPFNSAR